MTEGMVQQAIYLQKRIDHCKEVLKAIAECREHPNRTFMTALTHRKKPADENDLVYYNYAFELPDTVVLELKRTMEESLWNLELEFAAL